LESKEPAPIVFPEIPAKYVDLLNPAALTESMDALDGTVNELMSRDDAYGSKGTLLRKKVQLENAIKLKEATAIMDDPVFPTLKNETQRDAFRRTASADERTELAEVDGQLAEIDVAIAKEREEREKINIATESMQRRAGLQTALLNFLSMGGNS
jgi:hypothetical protein